MKKIRTIAGFAILLLLVATVAFAGVTDPYEILYKQYEAMGGLDKIKSQKTSHIEGAIEIIGTGLKGTVKVWSEYPIKNRTEADLGVFKQITGDNGEYSWSIDMNGKLQISKDSLSLIRRKLSLLTADYDFLNRDSKYYALSYEGIDTVNGVGCYVVKTSNNLNDDYTTHYIDTATFLEIKTVSTTPNGGSSSILSDYRDVDGVLMAFKTESTLQPTGMVQVLQITKAEVNIDIDDSKFEPSTKKTKDFHFTKGHSAENIKFQYILNHIYLPVEVDGKTRLWVLDSGAGQTVISEKFAKELGLKTEGNIKGQGAGNLVDVSFAEIPEFSVGNLEFDKQKAVVIELDKLFHSWIGLDVAGILGYDFLSRLVVKVDYAKQLLSFYDPEKFEYRGLGTVINAPLSGNMFHIPITVDGQYGGLWNLDLGAGGMSFHFPFASKNGLLKRPGITVLGAGAGGTFKSKAFLSHSVTIGDFTVNNLVFTVPMQEGKGAFNNAELTGNAGNTLFEHFVLYLDYMREQVIVEKGDDFDRVFPRDNSGLGIQLTDNDRLRVHFVSEGTPADKAGFQVNDTILSINNIKTEYFGGIVSLKKMMREPPGTQYKIKVRRNGREKELKLKLSNLYKK